MRYYHNGLQGVFHKHLLHADLNNYKIEVFITVYLCEGGVEILVVLGLTPHNFTSEYQRFGRACCPHVQG
jgi:hypothetical protein